MRWGRGAAAGPSLATCVLWGVVAGGILATLWSVQAVHAAERWPSLLPLLALAAAAELLTFRVYQTGEQNIDLSFTVAVTMAAVAVYPAAAPLVNLVAAAVHVARVRVRRPDKLLFNFANPVLAATAGAWTYLLLNPEPNRFTIWHLGAALVATVAFNVTNFGLVSLMISLHTRRPLVRVLAESAWYHPAKVFIGLTGAFVGGGYPQIGALGAAMFAVPLLILRYTLALYARKSRETIQTLRHQALHDQLTDLPNRTLLREQLEQAVQPRDRGRAAATPGRADSQPVALLVMDLDRFKEVNDTFGHHHGDLLLQQVGTRLQGVLRPPELVARLGGDEFAVLLPAAGVAEASARADTILRTLEQPFTVDGYRLEVGASIGIALSPEHGTDADTLLRRADVAMYTAKRAGSGHALYVLEQDQYSPERLALIGELRTAIEQDELILHYQPKLALGTGLGAGVEALVRWEHPRRGRVPPDAFIPLAEQTGLIRPLTLWVLTAALRQSRVWQDAGLPIAVAVNLSMRDLQDPLLPEAISALLSAGGVAPGRLTVEVTESSLMADPARAVEVVTRLRATGVRIAMDDFGTGYSSLSYLKQLPVDELKLDKSFVQSMAVNSKDAAIVRSTIGLCHDLGISVVAEGVEDEATRSLLETFGCDVIQGYYLHRPAAAHQLTPWLSAHTQRRPRSLASGGPVAA